jgi:hypothetical protein
MSNYRKTMSDALREMYPLDEGTIDKVKEIASKKQAMKIDGVMVDSFTASAISQIYDRVNDANKKKMDSLPITKLANLAFKMMQKNEFVPEEADLDEAKPEFEVKYAKSKGAPIKVTKFMTLDQAKKFLADVKKDGMNGIISRGGKPVKEESDLDEATMSSSQIARLKTAYEPMRDKKISVSNADKLSAMMDKVGKDKEALIQLFKADIPFVSQSAATKLITKHNMKGAEINKLREEVDLDEFTVSDVEIAMKKKYGKVDKEAIEKLKKVQHMGNVDRNALVKVGHGKLHVESVDLDEGKILVADPKTQKVTKIDEKDWPEYEKKGYVQAEGNDLDEGKQKPYVSSDSDGKHVMGASGKIVKSFKDMDSANAYLKKNYNELMKESDLDEGKMSQLHQYMQDKKSPEEIAKLMKLDVKTIKSLMSSHHPEDVEEASAYADARRSMSKDKDFSRKDSADDDTDASDDDVKGASKNIIMQMRKAQSLSGNFAVEFGDGKKVKIPAKMAVAVQQKYNAMKKPVDKEKFQARIGKSYKDMLSALKEELQPKKESILERMNRKIKENKHG